MEWAQLMRLETVLQPADIEAAVHKLSGRSDSAAHVSALERAVTEVVSIHGHNGDTGDLNALWSVCLS